MLKGVVMLLFIVMFVVTSVCYTKVVIVVRNQHKIMAQRRQANLWNIKHKSSEGKRKWIWSFPFSQKRKIKPVSTENVSIPGLRKSGQPSKESITTIAAAGKESGYATEEQLVKQPSTKLSHDSWAKGNNILNTSPGTSKESKELSCVQKEENVLNKVTLMLFLITLLYIITWLLHWGSALVNDSTSYILKALMRSCKYMFMINCVTNPIFYSLMSSKFRSKTVALFKRKRNVSL